MELRLIFASHNQNKVNEIQSMMPAGIHVLSLSDIGFDEDIEENGKTLDDNALIKAKRIYEQYGISCFADDTGLLVDALNGEPGVFSARYAGPQKNDADNIELLLKNLNEHPNKEARFQTSIALILHGETLFFHGKVEGKIIHEKRGNNGFGYDPVFVPENQDKTFAEMNMAEKNANSHRARAFKAMVDYLSPTNQ